MKTSQGIKTVFPDFSHKELNMFTPDFDSKVMDLIIELEKLRNKRIYGTSPPMVFMQIKSIFHKLESVETLRFESNPTTVIEYIKDELTNPQRLNEESNLAIKNIEKALKYIDENIQFEGKITQRHIRELHYITVEGLTPPPPRGNEGSRYPGSYKQEQNGVGRHIPPPPGLIESYMEELESFINKDWSKKYELMVTTIAHHRFTRIHPFDNGNGRVGRLLTYAMLVKQGFINEDLSRFQVLNPTGIFGDKRQYSNLLEKCDTGSDSALEEWCEYTLGRILGEINKINKLLDYGYLSQNILIPSIESALERKDIDQLEFQILEQTIKSGYIMLKDIKHLLPQGKSQANNSYYLNKLKDRKLLVPVDGDQSRKYVFGFTENKVLISIVNLLREEGFVNFDQF